MWKSLITILISFLAVSAFSADLDSIQLSLNGIQASLDCIYRGVQVMYMCFAMMFGFFVWWTCRLN